MEDKGKKLSRREFLRLAGLGIGGLAVANVAAAPAKADQSFKGGKFSDPAGRLNRPWWVRTVDEPTTEVDWAKVKRYNEREGTVRGPGHAKYMGEDKVTELRAKGAEVELNGMLNNVDGYTLKDQALKSAHASYGRDFIGPQKAKTPEDRGVPKWEGSPEEASKIIRAAMRHFGAATVGFVEMNEDNKKLTYAVDPDGKDVVFTDDDMASEDETTRYVPNKAKYVIAFTVQMSTETMRRAPTPLGSQTTTLTYRRSETIQASLQEFLRGLGYQCLSSSSTNALAIAPAWGVLAGLGEMSRLNRMITPEFGPMVRAFIAYTDLPVAVDKPIDAGIMEFCKRCKKCAEACPSESLSFLDEPTWDVQGEWNNPGHKAYFENAVTCVNYWREGVATNCGICFSVCPYAKKDKAWIHEFIKASSSTAPVLDGFFRSMDDAFGYGIQASAEEWWDLDLPEYGIDSNQSVMEA